MFKRVLAIVLLWSVEAAADLGDMAYFKLDNGLEVAVICNHKAPVAQQMVFYKTGSINDPNGKGGLAHLMEHLMFRGTKSVPDQAFNRLTDVYGAENNAFTTYEVTAYHEFSDVSKLELMMALEADRMIQSAFSDEAFLKEREVVLQERLQRFETKSTPLFYETIHKLLWQDHPKAQPVSGSVADIKSLTADDVRRFYRQWYRPDNALLVLSGDISAEEGKKLALKYYGDIKIPTEAKSVIEKPKGLKKQQMKLEMALPFVEQPRYVRAQRVNAGVIDKKEALALAIYEAYLSEDDTSFLYDRLVYKDKRLLAVDVDFDYDADNGAVMTIYATPAEGVGFDEVERIINAAWAAAYSSFSDKKVEQIKQTVLANMVYMQENPVSAAQFVGLSVINGYTIDEIVHYDEMIKEITKEDVEQALKKFEAAEKVLISAFLKGEE